MSIHYNKLTFNGKSTADFPFNIYVSENDGINKAKRKSNIFTTDYVSGGILRDVNAYETIEKSYKLSLFGVDLNQLNDLLVWLDGSGRLITPDNPNRYYEVLSVSSFKSKIDEVNSFEFDVVFTCNPFSYSLDEEVKTYTSNGTIDSNSSIIMYPKVVIYGNSTTPTTLTIGRQVVHLKNLDTKLTVECKPGEQNVFDKNGNLCNSLMKGAFFEIPQGRHGVVRGSGITKVEIYCRWGAFI